MIQIIPENLLLVTFHFSLKKGWGLALWFGGLFLFHVACGIYYVFDPLSLVSARDEIITQLL